MAKCMQFDTQARSNRKERRKANALAKKTKIVMEESLAAMPKFILEVKDGVILLFNEHVPYPDGWYWHTIRVRSLDHSRASMMRRRLPLSRPILGLRSRYSIPEAGSRNYHTILLEVGCRS